MVEAVHAREAQPEEQLQNEVLTLLKASSEIADSADLCAEWSLSAAKMDAILKSLLVDDYVVLEVIERRKIELTEEGVGYAESGTPEYQYASALTVGQ